GATASLGAGLFRLDSSGDMSLIDVQQLLGVGGPAALRRLSETEARALPSRLFEVCAESQQLCCSICLENFSHGMRINVLPCSHTFHEECMFQWVTRAALCPNCRAEIETPSPSAQSARSQTSV
ncbi:unnamed protein product, partial [Polarella glacialis]